MGAEAPASLSRDPPVTSNAIDRGTNDLCRLYAFESTLRGLLHKHCCTCMRRGSAAAAARQAAARPPFRQWPPLWPLQFLAAAAVEWR